MYRERERGERERERDASARGRKYTGFPTLGVEIQARAPGTQVCNMI